MALPDLKKINSIPEALIFQAMQFPNRKAFIFLSHPPHLEGPSLTFSQLLGDVKKLATALGMKAKPGDRVLLVFENDLQYIVSFLASLWAGVIAVPVYPPVSKIHEARLKSVIEDCVPSLILTNRFFSPLCPPGLPKLIFEDLEQIDEAGIKAWDSRGIALIQYTSGSTGEPKGVRLSHKNLLSSIDMMVQGYHLNPSDIQVTWLPMYHDMGLIGGVLAALTCAITTYVMTPMSIVRPFKWLKTISLVKATITATPNFALDLAVDRISGEEFKDLDLRSLEKIICAGEQNRPKTLKRFAETFSQVGLDPRCILPAWGLAEGTLVLACEKWQHGFTTINSGGSEYVSCGYPTKDVDVRICSEAGNILAENEVGEVWVSSPTISDGYWNESREVMSLAVLGDKVFLKTGDMGFLRGGHLVISGRKKEMIKVRGCNIFPQDIETAARESGLILKKALMAAFCVDNGAEERIVLAMEVPPGTRRTELSGELETIKAAILEKVQTPLIELLCLRKGSISRTTSGKLKRLQCKKMYQENRLELFQDDWRNTITYFRVIKRLSRLRFFLKLKLGI